MKFLNQALKSLGAMSKAASAAQKLVSSDANTSYPVKTSSKAPKGKGVAKSGKSYPVGIVGERSYQLAIRRLREREAVTLWHEPDNPYDDRAIAVATSGGDTIGYLPRDFWLRDALLDEGKPCTAKVLRLAKDGRTTGVVIEVTLAGTAIETRAFKNSY